MKQNQAKTFNIMAAFGQDVRPENSQLVVLG